MRSANRPYSNLFFSFFSAGVFTLGGGYAMLPLLARELKDKNKWFSDSEFVDALAVAQSAPGPMVVNLAALTGYRLGGIPGALVAVWGAVLPSFVAMLLVASTVTVARGRPVLEWALYGVRPAALALVLVAAVNIGRNVLGNVYAIAIFLAACIGLLAGHIHPLLVLAGAGLAGFWCEAGRRKSG